MKFKPGEPAKKALKILEAAWMGCPSFKPVADMANVVSSQVWLQLRQWVIEEVEL